MTAASVLSCRSSGLSAGHWSPGGGRLDLLEALRTGEGWASPRCARPVCRRSVRVGALIVGILVLSAADLYMTLLHLSVGGLLESNPIARAVMSHSAASTIALWKIGTVLFSCGVMWWARERRLGELAAWCCLAVLAALTVRWMVYADGIHVMTPAIVEPELIRHPHWVMLAQR